MPNMLAGNPAFYDAVHNKYPDIPINSDAGQRADGVTPLHFGAINEKNPVKTTQEQTMNNLKSAVPFPEKTASVEKVAQKS